jgi:hypothetical protein
MPQLTDKEIAERVKAKYLEVKSEREEWNDLHDDREKEEEEYKKTERKLRTKQYLLEEILGIE